jgi:hypothetical protein
VKRLSPVLIIAAIAAVAAILLKGSGQKVEPDSNWQPVEPS